MGIRRACCCSSPAPGRCTRTAMSRCQCPLCPLSHQVSPGRPCHPSLPVIPVIPVVPPVRSVRVVLAVPCPLCHPCHPCHRHQARSLPGHPFHPYHPYHLLQTLTPTARRHRDYQGSLGPAHSFGRTFVQGRSQCHQPGNRRTGHTPHGSSSWRQEGSDSSCSWEARRQPSNHPWPTGHRPRHGSHYRSHGRAPHRSGRST